MRFGVVVFPGTWSDRDFGVALRESLEQDVRYVWHKERDLTGLDCVVLPGGFAYGDYLRTGAIASLSPVMDSIATYAERGGLVFGSCNGFQILCEAGLLPGALLRNDHLEFRCEWTHLRVENADTPFTRACAVGDALGMPVSHGEGRYFADPKDLRDLGAQQSGGLPLRQRRRCAHGRGQPQRLLQQHRGHRQQARQRARHDAPPRARIVRAPRRRRRPPHLPIYPW